MLSQEVGLSDIERLTAEFVGSYFPDGNFSVSTVYPGQQDSDTLFYIVNLKPEGWLLISANMKVKPVLGFGFSGEYNYPDNNINNPEYIFIYNYEEQISAIKSISDLKMEKGWVPGAFRESKSKSEDLINVSNLIPVNWDQGRNWNIFCPEDQDGPGGHAYVGCVAVSMAQAMSVYAKPDHGIGSKDYLNDRYGMISADFASAEYKWDSMSLDSADEYNALLLYHCAVSVEMDFGPDGSSAQTARANTALRTYFSMSKESRYRSRSSFPDEWISMIHENLLAGQPLIYKGDANDGEAGHAFNIDGVINSDYFHINWGWSGSNNGYFLLDDLTPGTNNFTQNHAAIFGIQPYYYPTGVELSSYFVPQGVAAGASVWKINIVDEALDNEYIITLVSDSTFVAGSWYRDYYIDGDTLRTGILFPDNVNTTDTIWFMVSDIYDNYIEAEVVLIIGDTSTTSIGKINERSEDLILYPNPVSEILRIESSAGEFIRSIRIYSLDGSILSEIYLHGQSIQLDVSFLQKGLYILELNYSDGIIVTRKFIRR